MAQTNISWTPLIFGGIFGGFWLFGLLFGFEDQGWHDFNPGFWALWGFVGLVIAGGLYAARMTNDMVRIGLIIFVGVALGLLIMATFLEEEAHIVASFLTAVGAGLIVAAIPRPKQAWQETEEAPDA